MKVYLLLLTTFAATLAEEPNLLVGCENNPCQQICTDTSSSYYCECFQNYLLHPDGHSCTHLNTDVLEKSYLGCWDDSPEHRDLKYLIWSRPNDATVSECMHNCRSRGFSFAGLQGGAECWCDDTHHRAYNMTGVCDMDCPGAPTQTCGGVYSNSLYQVARDERYMGCYNEVESDTDLPAFQWGPTEGASVDACITKCNEEGYLYAGVFNGGQCTCGDSYGRHGESVEILCDVKCHNGWGADNCGGNATNAIYRVVRGNDISGLFDSEEVRAEIALSDIFLYPNTMGIFSRRMLVYASDTVNTIHDDTTCSSGECYNLCGTISHPPGLDSYSEDVIIREFYLKLSDIPGRINYPDVAQRVYVYVQTLYVDQTVDFPWSMYLHARQIIINYEVDPEIVFDHTGPEFDVNMDDVVINGLPSDLTFQKLSLLCARMMISAQDETNNRVGWDIIDDLARGHSYTAEQGFFLDQIRAIRSEFTSAGRNNVNLVPYYTKEFYVNSLEIYYDQIMLYNDMIQDMIDRATDCQAFVDNAGGIIQIWTDTLISQVKIIRQYAETNLNVSAEVYEGVYVEYNKSIDRLDDAEDIFEDGIDKWARRQAAKAMIGLIRSVFRLVRGKFPCGAKDVANDLYHALGGVIRGLELLDVTMENLAKTMEELAAFLLIADEIIISGDYQRYMDNVEAVAALYVMIPEWETFRYQVQVIFDDDEFQYIDGAMGYRDAVIDLSDWGEELTRSVIDYSVHIRRYMTADALVQNKELMQDRYEEYFAEVQADCQKQEQAIIRFAEQQYDIMLDLNDQLIQMCQAMYYETMDTCPESVRPNFAYNIDSLLLSINSAVQYVQSYTRPSGGVISLQIEDSPEAWQNCTDMRICPIKMFRESRTLYLPITLDHRSFTGIDLFLVEEMEVYVQGATSTDSTKDYIRLIISSTGPFFNRKQGVEAVFMSRAINDLKFQYDLSTEEIEVAADLYRPSGAMIRNMTPFTTWVIKVDPDFTHIDVSQVQSATITFRGSFQM